MLTGNIQPEDNPITFKTTQLANVSDDVISPRLKKVIEKAVNPQYEERYTPTQLREQLEVHLGTITRRNS